MSFLDMIKDGILNEFSGSLTIISVALSLLVSFIIGLFITFVYRKTYTGVVYSKTFAICMILLAMVTALVIRTISSNLALSLGMVGALSIVRFRTAIKEPVDTVFMFWAITAGIMAGAGLYIVAVSASLTLGILYFITFSLGFKVDSKYLFIIKYDLKIDKNITEQVKKLPKYQIKSKTISKETCELSFEANLKEDTTALLDKFKNVDGVITASLITYQNDFGE